MSFKNFNLSAPILRALEDKKYFIPTPIQSQAIPAVISGKDVLGCAQTGTGKTAAFCIPLLQRLQNIEPIKKGVRALILTPTRELAIQVADNLNLYGRHLRYRNTLLYGGVSQHEQVRQIKKGPDIIVATPGRLIDLMNQGFINLRSLEILVLDEADRMLDMGFIHDIRKIVAASPSKRQNLFFSATMPKEIQHLASAILKDPVEIRIAKEGNATENINQSVYYVQKNSKRKLLKYIITENNMENVLVFSRTKYGADRIAKDLNRAGISAEALHGNKSQNARQRALINFKKKTTRVLVATDIAARGIDIVDLPFVINFELPQSSDTYIHRIGRTGRAGARGAAFSLCDSEEKSYLNNINKKSSQKIKVLEHPFV